MIKDLTYKGRMEQQDKDLLEQYLKDEDPEECEIDQCPFCLQTEISKEPVGNHFWGVICSTCGIAYLEKY